jgi:hypothetical protein
LEAREKVLKERGFGRGRVFDDVKSWDDLDYLGWLLWRKEAVFYVCEKTHV